MILILMFLCMSLLVLCSHPFLHCTSPTHTLPPSDPPMTAFAFTSTDSAVDILSVADVMEERGWRMEVH